MSRRQFLSPPAVGGGGGVSTSDVTGPTIVIPAKSKSLTASCSSGVVAFGIGPVAEDTIGMLSLKTDGKVKSGGKKKVLALGFKSFQALEGQKASVRIKLS